MTDLVEFDRIPFKGHRQAEAKVKQKRNKSETKENQKKVVEKRNGTVITRWPLAYNCSINLVNVKL